MTDRVDIVIAGGGLNGPCLGLALAQAGLDVAVVDPRPAQARAGRGFDGRAYALALASQRLLAGIGVWDRIAAEAQPITRVDAIQARDTGERGFFGLHFDASELEEGPLGFMVEDRHLYTALLERMSGGLRHEAGVGVRGEVVGDDGVEVALSDGRMIAARLLVGADGRGSGVAQRAGIRRVGWDYGQTAIVCSLAHQKSHGGTATQIFLPGGPLAILPLKENRSLIVWSLPHDEAEALKVRDDAAFLDVLRPVFDLDLGEISLAGPRFDYPLGLSLATRYVAPRRALIGDAAHGVHPIAGQGLNLGLRDVAALAQCVVDAWRRGEDVGADTVLERFQRWRRFDSTVLAAGMDGTNRLFSNDNPVVRMARGVGLGIVQGLPALRRGFMREAAGMSVQPMPRLLAGLPL